MTDEFKIVRNYIINDFCPYQPLMSYNLTLIIKPINPIQNGINILL